MNKNVENNILCNKYKKATEMNCAGKKTAKVNDRERPRITLIHTSDRHT